MEWIGSDLFNDDTCHSGHIGLGLSWSWKNICMEWIGSDLFNDDTCHSGHIGLGLSCHIYVDTTAKVKSDLVKCE